MEDKKKTQKEETARDDEGLEADRVAKFENT